MSSPPQPSSVNQDGIDEEAILDDKETPEHSTPDISRLSIQSDGVETKRRPVVPLTQVRSVSDTGPSRQTLPPRISSSHSSGASSPLAAVQAARQPVPVTRPGSSSASSSASMAGGIPKLPAGMQAKMKAVIPPT